MQPEPEDVRPAIDGSALRLFDWPLPVLSIIGIALSRRLQKASLLFADLGAGYVLAGSVRDDASS